MAAYCAVSKSWGAGAGGAKSVTFVRGPTGLECPRGEGAGTGAGEEGERGDSGNDDEGGMGSGTYEGQRRVGDEREWTRGRGGRPERLRGPTKGGAEANR